MNLFAKITETLSAIVGKEVKAETATELDEALIALKAEREAQPPVVEVAEKEDEPTAEERLEADNALLQSRIEALEADEQRLKDNLAIAESSVEKLKGEVKSAYEEVSSLKDALNASEAKVKDLEASVRAANAVRSNTKTSAEFPEAAMKEKAEGGERVVQAASTGAEIFPKMTIVHR